MTLSSLFSSLSTTRFVGRASPRTFLTGGIGVHPRGGAGGGGEQQVHGSRIFSSMLEGRDVSSRAESDGWARCVRGIEAEKFVDSLQEYRWKREQKAKRVLDPNLKSLGDRPPRRNHSNLREHPTFSESLKNFHRYPSIPTIRSSCTFTLHPF